MTLALDLPVRIGTTAVSTGFDYRSKGATNLNSACRVPEVGFCNVAVALPIYTDLFVSPLSADESEIH